MKFTDPLGPGSPAWNCFDEAIIAWQSGNKRRYENKRDQCLRHVVKAGGNRTDWAEWLTRDRDDPDALRYIV